MSVARDLPAVLIVDRLPLRILGLAAILKRLSDANTFRIVSLPPEEAKRWLKAAAPCIMIIYNVGGASLTERMHIRCIKALRATAAGTPLVVFSDNNTREEVIGAFSVGAQGFLYAGTQVEPALKALSFILNGGSYFPSAVAAKRPRSSHLMNVAVNAKDLLSEPELQPENVHIETQHGVETCLNSGLTNRQKTVLMQLGRGASNKTIARALGIREGTVKVHVQQIMRKLGVTNRTQIAIACVSNSPVRDITER